MAVLTEERTAWQFFPMELVMVGADVQSIKFVEATLGFSVYLLLE